MNSLKSYLQVSHPDLAAEILGVDPNLILSTSLDSFQWRCNLGHVYRASLPNRIHRASGCPFCKNQKVLTGFNDLATTHPDIAQFAFGWDPSKVIAGTHKKLTWKCLKGHEFICSGQSMIASKNLPCPFCNNRKVLAGYNDLGTTHPEIAKQAFEWDVREYVSGSSSKKRWKCSFGHVWEAAINARTTKKRSKSGITKGTGCPFCAGKKIQIGFNDLETTHPDIAKEADGWDPKGFNSGSNKILTWKCSAGHKWKSSINNRTRQTLGCPVCSGQQVQIGFNDLATTHPIIASEAYLWDPRSVSKGSNKKLKFKCSEGHVWEAEISNRTLRGDGCPSCANFGFDPNKEGYFYLLKHENWQLLQIGITNHIEDRLKKHEKLGWKVVEVRGPMDGLITRNWETSILRFLQKKGVKLGPVEVAGKFDGYSECWIEEEFHVSSISALFIAARQED